MAAARAASSCSAHERPPVICTSSDGTSDSRLRLRHLYPEMQEVGRVHVCDAADKLRSECPEFFVVLDTMRRDPSGQRARHELRHFKVDVVRDRAVLVHSNDALRIHAGFQVQQTLSLD